MSPVSNAHLLAERIPATQLHLVEGGRHGFFEEYRSQVVRLIRTFLA